MKTYTFVHKNGNVHSLKAGSDLEAWSKMITKFSDTSGWAIASVK